MAIQFLRGTTAQNDNYTGPIGSYTIDTEKNQIRLHDGVTQGGVAFLNSGDLATTSVPGFMSSSDKEKLDSISQGAEPNSVDSVNGETGSVSLDTGDISENGNLYFTDSRAVSAIKGDPSWNATNWDEAYSWGDHASEGYALSSSLSLVATSGSYADLSDKPDLSGIGTATWGQVSGTLSDQTDLNNALNSKAPTNSPTFTGVVTIDEGGL